jgi:filamentous hemagglutinin family protein
MGCFAKIALHHPAALAQITPDSTLGVESSIVTPNANVRDIPAEFIQGGATRGVNLFHSFLEFNVGNGQRVYFANPTGIENILSRVTGNNLSNILGTLGVDGGASLFLLNPNGIIFGENARLDIAGSFVASTANSVVFENGTGFSATNPEAPPLLTINVTPGLQYGTNQANATIANAGNLTVGQNLTLSAGNLDLQGQLVAGGDLTLFAMDTVRVRDSVVSPFIASANGNLLVQGNQVVDIFALNHPDSGLFSGGNMVLRSDSTVGGDAHYWSGGSFRIEKLDGSLGDLYSPYDPIILADGDVTLGDYTGASLHILAGGSVTLGNVEITGTDSGENTINPNNPDPFLASLATVPLSDGTTLTIDGSVKSTLDVRAGIDWTTFPQGSPGNRTIGTVAPTPVFGGVTSGDITVNGNIRVSQPDGVVLLTNQYRPNGLVGNISTQDVDTSIEITTDLPVSDGGAIRIDSRGSITTEQLSSSSFSSDGGNGGAITLLAETNITTDRLSSRSELTSYAFDGHSKTANGGAITLIAGGNITTGELLSNTDTYSDIARGGNGGKISLTAGGNITTGDLSSSSYSTADGNSIAGNGGEISLSAGGNIIIGELSSYSLSLTAYNFSTSGNGGAITLSAGGNISTEDLSSYSYSSSVFYDSPSNAGNGGEIALFSGGSITTGDLSSYSYSYTDVETSGLSQSSNGGAIALLAESNITTGELSSYSYSLSSRSITTTGNGGDIELTANHGRIVINPSDNDSSGFNPPNSDFPRIDASGVNGGDVILTSPTGLFELQDGVITSNALGDGNGGRIEITAGSVSLTNTELTSTTSGIGNSGSILLISDGLVSLDKSRLFTSLEVGGIGTGGDITIDAGQLSVTDFSFINTATFGQGDAGNVLINVDDSVSLDNNSFIFSITGGQGNGGNVSVNAGGTVSLTNSSNISTAVESRAEGKGGNIEVTGRSLSLTGGSQLVTSTASADNAGDITVNTTEGVIISGIDPNFTPPQASNVPITPPSTVDAQTAQTQNLNNFLSLDSPDNVNSNVEFSTRIPYVSISGGVSYDRDSPDSYSFEVTAGTQGIFDFDGDSTYSGGSRISIFKDGNELASNSGSPLSLGAGGSQKADPYLRYVFTEPGIYTIQVTANESYTLQVSLATPDVARSVDRGVLPSGLFARTEGAGVAGNITINTPQLTVLNGGNVSATATAAATSSAQGGSVKVNANQVNLLGNTSGLFALTEGVAPAGLLTLQPYNNEQTLTINLQDGAQISASTSGAGQGGSIIVTAPESITITGNGILAATADVSSTGQAGDVLLATRQLTISNEAQVSASTNSANPEAIGGSLRVQAEQLNLTGNSSLSAGTTGAADGGNLIIQPLGESQTLTINFQDGSTASAATSGSGKGGTVTVSAPEAVTLSGNGSLISAETTGSGAGGDIGIETGQLTVQDGAQIRASAFSSGNGGNLTVNASDSVQLRGENSGLFVNATAGSTAGNLTVNTNEMSVTEGAQVTVSSPQGQAGSLSITANTLTLNRGTLSAVTGTSGTEGGANITLSNLDFLRMDNESLISASALDAANGGNVTIDSTLIVATPPTGPEGSDIIANAEQGNGGQVNITTQGLFGIEFRPQRTPKNDITVSSTFGLSGEFTLNSPGVDPSRGLAELPINITDASELIDRRCTPGSDARQSSFTITGRGGLPPSPNNPLTNNEVQVDWATLEDKPETPDREPTNTKPTSSKPQQLVEAQGWMIDENGQITLTAQAAKVTPQGEWLSPLECHPLPN